jgi:hypothetical protein
MRHDLNLLLRNDLLSFAKKAFWEMNAQRMPDDRYLELLASRLAEVVTGDSKRLIVNLPQLAVSEPAGACKECTFRIGIARPHTAYKTILHQLVPDRRDGARDAFVLDRQKTHEWKQQQARIEVLAPVVLDESAKSTVILPGKSRRASDEPGPSSGNAFPGRRGRQRFRSYHTDRRRPRPRPFPDSCSRQP